MRRTLAALALASGLVLGPGPALAQQVQQPQRDNAAVAALAGLLALGVIGAIVSDDDDDDDDDRDRVDVHRRGHDEYERIGRGRDEYDRDRWGRDDYDDEHDGLRDGRVLTADCVRHVRGGRRVIAGECLQRHGHRVRLPDQCLSWVHAGGRDRPVYDTLCLRGAGYSVR